MARKKYTKVLRGLGPRQVAAKENWPSDYFTGERRPPSPRTLLGDVDYERLIYILEFYPKRADAAAKLGVSTRTLRRYIHEGIPPGAKLTRRKQAAVFTGLKRREAYANLQDKPIKKTPVQIMRYLSGTRTDTVYIDGADYMQVLHLLLSKCHAKDSHGYPLYLSYSMTLKFDLGDVPELQGFWDKDNAHFIPVDSDDFKKMKKELKPSEIAALSFVTIAADHPFISTARVAMTQGACSGDDYVMQLQHAFGLAYMRPVSIVFYKPRPYMIPGSGLLMPGEE